MTSQWHSTAHVWLELLCWSDKFESQADVSYLSSGWPIRSALTVGQNHAACELWQNESVFMYWAQSVSFFSWTVNSSSRDQMQLLIGGSNYAYLEENIPDLKGYSISSGLYSASKLQVSGKYWILCKKMKFFFFQPLHLPANWNVRYSVIYMYSR